MTTKLHLPNIKPRKLLHKSSNYLKSIGIFLLILPSQHTLAQNLPPIQRELPPPPSLNGDRQVTESIPISIESKFDSDSKRQYNFETSSVSYRVEVYGNSQRVLSQVKRIVPNAFRKSGIIQVGIFQDPENAEDLILQLTSQGFWARIVTVDR